MSANDDQKDSIGFEAKPPAISRLPEDVLLHIFMKNTHNTRMLSKYYSPFPDNSNMFDDGAPDSRRDNTPRPLQHTRFSSQVCQQWRTVLLSLTSVWGRLIDFYSFNNKGDNWRDEVIQRSGSSMLWIVGGWNCMRPRSMYPWGFSEDDFYFDSHMDRHESFFWEFLHKNWERTEKLLINQWNGRDFSFLWRPAPNLKALHCYSTPNLHTRGNPDDMFACHAPRLISFRTQGCVFHPSIDSMSTIRDLALGSGYYRFRFTNREVIELLALLPLIETLDLQHHTMVEGYQSPIVHLPRLRTLKLVDCIDYLHTIKPASKCSFIIYNDLDAFMANHYIHPDVLANIYNDHLALHPRDKISLELSENEMSLSAGSLPQFDLPDHDVFKLEVKSRQYNSTSKLALLLEPFISPRVVDCFFYPRIMVPISKLQPEVCFVIKRFFYPFTLATSIALNKDYLDLLFAEELVPPIIFPRLRSLKLLHPDYELTKLHNFLDSRRKHQVPIEKIDMTPLDIDKISPDDLNALEEHKGMIVRYMTHGFQIKEYVCGSGHPEI